MATIHHFDHGWITPTVSYVLSVLGSMLGLVCAVRLRGAQVSSAPVQHLGVVLALVEASLEMAEVAVERERDPGSPAYAIPPAGGGRVFRDGAPASVRRWV